MPVRANPPHDTAVKPWINLRGLDGPAQAIPQRIFIFTMESFVMHARNRENPLNRASSATACPLAAGWLGGNGSLLVSQPESVRSVETDDAVYRMRVAG